MSSSRRRRPPLVEAYLDACAKGTPSVSPNRELLQDLAAGIVVFKWSGLKHAAHHQVVLRLLRSSAARDHLQYVHFGLSDETARTMYHGRKDEGKSSVSLYARSTTTKGRNQTTRTATGHATTRRKTPRQQMFYEMQYYLRSFLRLVHQNCMKVVHLRLDTVVLTKKDIGYVSPIIARLHALELHHIRWKGDSSFALLYFPVRDAPRLQLLTCRDCRLSSYSARTISRLVTLHSTRRQSMEWAVGLRGGEGKARVAKNGLLILDLRENQIDKSGMQDLCRVLRDDPWMMGIHVGGNPDIKASMNILGNLQVRNKRLVVKPCGRTKVQGNRRRENPKKEARWSSPLLDGVLAAWEDASPSVEERAQQQQQQQEEEEEEDIHESEIKIDNILMSESKREENEDDDGGQYAILGLDHLEEMRSLLDTLADSCVSFLSAFRKFKVLQQDPSRS